MTEQLEDLLIEHFEELLSEYEKTSSPEVIERIKAIRILLGFSSEEWVSVLKEAIRTYPETEENKVELAKLKSKAGI